MLAIFTDNRKRDTEMALHPCHECGKKVSTSAKLCPHCGAPPRGDSENLSGNEPAADKSEPKPIEVLLGIVAMVAFLYYIALSNVSDLPSTKQPASQATPRATGVLNSRVVACRSKAGADDLLDAAARVGDAAYQEKARQLVNSGQYSTFAPGAKCVVVDGSILGASKVYIGDRGPYYIHGASEFGCGAK